MQQNVSITKQGQMTIPKKMLAFFGLQNGGKAFIKIEKNKIIVDPKADFWSLAGSLGKKTKIKLTDKQLKDARSRFEKDWARKI